MKTLIVEDDATSRVALEEMLKEFGPVQLASNGKEGVDAVRSAFAAGRPFDLVCLDITMPELDGFEALKEMRGIEAVRGLKSRAEMRIFMTTALDGVKNVIKAVSMSCDAYLLKPIEKAKLLERLDEFGLTLTVK